MFKKFYFHHIIIILLLIIFPGKVSYGLDIFPEIVFRKEIMLDMKSVDNLNIDFALSNNGFELRELYLHGDIFGGELSLGKRYYRSGPGYFSQLLLSDQNTPLNMIMHEGQFTVEDYENNYTMLLAYLDEGVNKQLFYHRISNDNLIEGLEIGLAESVIASEHIHPAYYLPIPFLPYYLISYMVGQDTKYNHYEDKYIGMDFIYQFSTGIELYGELLVDEYPQTSADNNPDKRGHLLGLYLPSNNQEFRVEYSNVFNYVYLHRYPQNSYTYKGKYLGHWLGHDGDILNLELKRRLKQDDIVKLGLSYLRKGIGDMETDFGSDHEEKKFLSKVTKREALLHLGYLRDIDENMSFEINSHLGRASYEKQEDEDIFKVDLSLLIKL